MKKQENFDIPNLIFEMFFEKNSTSNKSGSQKITKLEKKFLQTISKEQFKIYDELQNMLFLRNLEIEKRLIKFTLEFISQIKNLNF